MQFERIKVIKTSMRSRLGVSKPKTIEELSAMTGGAIARAYWIDNVSLYAVDAGRESMPVFLKKVSRETRRQRLCVLLASIQNPNNWALVEEVIANEGERNSVESRLIVPVYEGQMVARGKLTVDQARKMFPETKMDEYIDLLVRSYNESERKYVRER